MKFFLVTLILGMAGISLLLTNQFTTKAYHVEDNLPKYGAFGVTDKIYDGIIRLEDANYDFFCSAFVIDDNYAVTAAHCIEDKVSTFNKAYINVSDHSGVVIGNATAVAFNSRMDYGLIRGDFTRFKRFRLDLRNESVFKERSLMSCGFPLGQKGLYCVPVFPVGNAFFHIAAKGMLFPGMSGGPVINTTTGQVTAVNSAVTNGVVLLTPVIGILSSFGVEP